jgi:hypothetical protein
MRFDPSTLTSSNAARLVLARRWLLGETVQSVVYGLQRGLNRDPELSSGSVHFVDGYVEIGLFSGKLLHLTWGSPPSEEGLTQLFVDPGEPFVRDTILALDASGLPEWRGVIGHQVGRYSLSFSRTGEPPQERPWSLRLGIGGTDVVVGLGRESQVEEAELTYSATDMVVIFDRAIAESYTTVDGRSAWSDDNPVDQSNPPR